MIVLKGVLRESSQYYLDIKRRIERRLLRLPRGSVKERIISGRKYYYLQQRVGDKVVHRYLGSKQPESLMKDVRERVKLRKQLREVNDALRLLRRVEDKR
jgi:hypothetical protein